MTICNGCSRNFPYLDDARCQSCTNYPPSGKPLHEWPTCADCGSSFEFLVADTCHLCAKRAKDSETACRSSAPTASSATAHSSSQVLPSAESSVGLPGDAIRYAMAHPVNVREHGTSGGTSTVNPYLVQPTYELLESSQDPRAQKAFRTIHNFRTGYADAISRHNPHMLGGKAAKSKLKGELQTTRPVPRLNVAITAVSNRNKPSLKVVFDPFAQAHPEDREFKEVIDSVRLWLDGIYSQQYKHRIQSNDDFSILYSSSALSLDPSARSPGTTLRQFWDKSIESGLHVKPKEIKMRILNLTLRVNYPSLVKRKNRRSHSSSDNDSSDDNGDIDPAVVTGRKRKADAYIEPENASFKRSVTGRTYLTKISRIPAPVAVDDLDTESFIVKKLKFGVNDIGDGFDWTTSADAFKIIIDKKEFASGVTKKAYKLRFGSKVFCAKRFYFIGRWGEPSFAENKEHLQEEVLRHHSIQEALTNFLCMAKANKISVHDLKIATSMLLIVAEGPQEGLTWLVDELLDHEKMRKFSGTDMAGAAGDFDFAGSTCDAFAHFTAADSNLDIVVVDIQGISTPVYHDGLRCADAVTLFDLLAHSKCQTMGLGDRGLEGIEKFCQQHKCNVICKRLELPSLDHLWKTMSLSESPEDLARPDMRRAMLVSKIDSLKQVEENLPETTANLKSPEEHLVDDRNSHQSVNSDNDEEDELVDSN